jgi:hypothetical protein
MRFLLRNWQYALPIILSVALVVTIGLWRLEVADGKIKDAEIARLDEEIENSTLEINQCVSDKALTEKVSNDYQNANIALRRERDRLRGQPGCVFPKSSSPSGVHSGAGNELSNGNGIRAEWLYDFAGRAEQDRITGAACIKFMDQLYQSRGYND